MSMQRTMPCMTSTSTTFRCSLKIARRALCATAFIASNTLVAFQEEGGNCYSEVNKRVYQHQSHRYRQFIICEYCIPHTKTLFMRCEPCLVEVPQVPFS
jgi:hypothetical protein